MICKKVNITVKMLSKKMSNENNGNGTKG